MRYYVIGLKRSFEDSGHAFTFLLLRALPFPTWPLEYYNLGNKVILFCFVFLYRKWLCQNHCLSQETIYSCRGKHVTTWENSERVLDQRSTSLLISFNTHAQKLRSSGVNYILPSSTLLTSHLATFLFLVTHSESQESVLRIILQPCCENSPLLRKKMETLIHYH